MNVSRREFLAIALAGITSTALYGCKKSPYISDEMYKLGIDTVNYARDASKNNKLTSDAVARKLRENADKAEELAAAAPKEATKNTVIASMIGQIATYSKVGMASEAKEATERLAEALEK